ncbi:MAG: hypothetical protein QG619_933 [Pseudomonadota bacterium]|nr:hypothetical protein [Pseudomonadota bacterium]
MNITITSGIVSKDGEEIGQIVGDECISFRVIGPTVKAAINKAHGSKLRHTIKDQDNEQNQKAPISPKPEIRQDVQESRELPMVPIEQAPQTPTQGAVTVAFGLPRLLALADAGKIPTPPLHHPAMGDKAPDFVKWFQTHATPDEVSAKYPPTRRIPASFADYERAEKERLNRKLNGEKKDTAPSQDFADADEE